MDCEFVEKPRQGLQLRLSVSIVNSTYIYISCKLISMLKCSVIVKQKNI